MPKAQISRFRRLTAIALFSAITGLAAFSIDRTAEASVFGYISDGFAAAGNAIGIGQDETTNAPVTKQAPLAIGSDKLIFGQLSDGSPFDSSRVDKIKIFDPVTQALTDLGSVNDFEPVLSPDKTKIAFVSFRDKPHGAQFGVDGWRELYTMNVDGTDQVRLGSDFYGAEYEPSFAPTTNPPDQAIVFVADYSGQPSGIYKMTLYNSTTTLLTDGSNCAEPVFKGKKRERPTRSLTSNSTGFSTPNYSPDGNYVIFGREDSSGWNVYRVDAADGGNCTLIYTDDSYSSFPPQASYSPDGSKIALVSGYEIFNGLLNNRVMNLRIVDASDGSYIEYSNLGIWSTPVWTADGQSIAFLKAGTEPGGGQIPNEEIGLFTIASQSEQQLYFSGIYDGLNGMSVGTPSGVLPDARMRITGQNPVQGGVPTQGTIYLKNPAPAGGVTFTLVVTNAQIGIMSVPPTVTIPQGQSEASFPINSVIRTDDGRTGDVFASTGSPSYTSAMATVSLRKTTPDLNAASFNAPASTSPDTTFNIDWTVQNIGLVTTGSNSGTDAVYFSLDNALDVGVDTWVTSYSNAGAPLAPGASRTRNSSGNIPSNAIPGAGDYYLIFVTNNNEAQVNENGLTQNNILVRPIHIDLPDLVAENLVVPAITEPGVNYTLTWDLKNLGTVPVSTNSISRVYFSFDNVESGDDLLLDTIADPPVAAGASVARSTNVNIPTVPVLSDGPGYFYVKVDYSGQVNEGTSGSTGETNNVLFAATAFQYRVPDIQSTASSVPVEVESDTQFAFTWTAANTGNKDAPIFSEQIYFSNDNVVGSDHLLGTFPLGGGLAAGASVERIQNVSIQTNWIPASGNYYLYVKTDSSNQLDEGLGESNNIRFQAVNVRRLLRPELQVANITAPANALFGEMITVQWTVTNNGQGPTNGLWKDRINLNTTGSTSGGTLIDVNNAMALEPGQSYTTSATVLVPNGYVGGYQVVVTTDIYGSLNEENTTNNTTTKPITIAVPPLPDLTVTQVQAPATGYAGLPFEVHWTGKNIGNADAQDNEKIRQNQAWSWSDQVYLSRDTVLSPGTDIRLSTFLGRSTPLAPDATYTRDTLVTENGTSTYVKLPHNVSGQYYVFVVLDSGDRIYEYTGETNNTGYAPVPVNIINTPPDLTITDAMIAPTSGTAGQAYQMSYTVRNVGAFATSNSRQDGVYLSTDTTWSADDTLLFSKTDGVLANGGSKTFTEQITIPFCFSGPLYLIPKTDINENVPEFDPGYDAEANNAGPANAITVTSLPPDIVATGLSTTPITQPGQSITITWTETNSGTGPTPSSWTDRLTLLRADGTYVTTLASPRMDGVLAAGASILRTVNVTLPAYMQDTYKISLEVNQGRNRAECAPGDANNITETSQFTVSNNLPDLVPQNISTDASSYVAGSPITVTFDETNIGQNAAIGQNGWTTYVYLSTDTSLSNNDQYLGTLNSTVALAGGASRSATVNGFIGNVPAGTYYVLTYLDGNNNVNEGPNSSLFETNNIQASGQISVTTPNIDIVPAINSVTTPTYTGQTIQIDYTTTNIGSQSTLTTHWTDFAYLSRDSVLDSTDTRIGWTNIDGGLAGGASRTDQITAQLPAGLSGDYRIFVKSDVNRTVVETSTANNLTAPFNVTLQSPPPSDLSITNITPGTTISPGGNATLNFTTQNSGANAAYGKWRTSFYLSRDMTWDVNDYLLGQKERNALPLAPGATETDTFGFVVPMIDEGQYFVIARVDSLNQIPESNEANNGLVSGTTTQAVIETLTLGTASNWSFTGTGQRLFKFLPPLDETVIVTLDGQDGSWNRLLSRASLPPTFAEYDHRDDGLRSPDKENSIANTVADKYFSMVKTDLIPNDVSGGTPMPGTQNLSIKAEVIGFSVRGVSPSSAGNAGVATLKITGAKFAPGATIELVRQGGGSTIPAKQSAISPTDIRALFDLTGKQAGMYDVRVTNPDSQVAVKTNGFEIVNGGGHQLRIQIAGPGAVSNVQTHTRFTLSVINDGINDAQAVPVVFGIPSAANYTLDRTNFFDWPQEMLPDGLTPADVPLHLEKDGLKLIFLMIPIVQGRSQVSVSFNLQTPMGTGFDLSYGIGIPWGDLTKIDDAVFRSGGSLTFHSGRLSSATADADAEYAKCMAEFIRALAFFILSEIGPQECASVAKTLIGGIVDYVSGIALTTATGQASETSVATGGVGLWIGLMKNAALCAGKSVPVLRMASLIWGIGNLINQLLDCLQHLYTWGVSVIVSLDPNEKIGPVGYGPDKFVGVGQPLEYRINFENVSEATAPAQKIYIVDDLPPGLDPRTVRLKEVGFHHYSYLVPDNSAVFQSREQLGSDLNDLKVNISAGLDIVNRRVTWSLTAIDPLTGEMPIDPTLGILPPNNASHDGEGYVIFTAQADATLPNRSPIANKAGIYFDANPVIETNTTANMIDSVIPSSNASIGSTTGDTPQVQFSWTGTDDTDGSGFASCSIFSAENDGAFMQVSLFPTLAGNGSFTGKWGKKYSLYSICRDNAGNVEAPPILPDATIQIRGGDTESDVAPRPDGSNGVVDGSDVTQIRRFAVALDGSMLYNEFQRADSAPKANAGDGAITVADIMQARRYAAAIDAHAEANGPNAVVPFAPKGVEGKRTNLLDPRGLSIVRAYRGMNKLRVAIQLSAQGDETATGFSLNFDPTVLSNPVVTAGDDATGGVITTNDTAAAAGKIGIILDKAPTDVFAAGYRFLVLVEFDVIGTPPATTVMSFGNDPVKTEVVDGLAASLTGAFPSATIELLSPTAATVSVGGRVIDASGRPVRNATLQLMQATGGRTRVITNAFGYFQFDNVVVGSTYVITTTARGMQFSPRVINVTDAITELEIQAVP